MPVLDCASDPLRCASLPRGAPCVGLRIYTVTVLQTGMGAEGIAICPICAMTSRSCAAMPFEYRFSFARAAPVSWGEGKWSSSAEEFRAKPRGPVILSPASSTPPPPLLDVSRFRFWQVSSLGQEAKASSADATVSPYVVGECPFSTAQEAALDLPDQIYRFRKVNRFVLE